jgi:hypothetical protein
MTSLDIRDQPRLSLARHVEICLDGIHHRLFRSTITLSVITFAIAFLMNMLVEKEIAPAMRRGVGERVAENRAASDFVAFFDAPVDAAGLRDRVDAATPGSWQRTTLTNWLGLSEAQLAELHADVRRSRAIRAWFQTLTPGQRRSLLGRRSDADVWQYLAQPRVTGEVAQAARNTPGLGVPPDFEAFAPRVWAIERRLAELAPRFSDRAEELRNGLPQRSVAAALDSAAGRWAPPGDLLAAWTEHGVAVSEDAWDLILRQARHAATDLRLHRALERPELADAWRARFTTFNRDTLVEEIAADHNRAAVVAQHIEGWTPQQVREIAQRMDSAAELNELHARLDSDYGSETSGGGVIWLIVVSFLVCIVGIVNAMLVNVIERFREIATMKCLGALDGFIAAIFILEASLLGLVGGVIGVALGLLVGLGRMTLAYGGWALSFFPWPELLRAAGLSVLDGLLLATLAAIYPSLRASRMPPMEAMRVE